MIKRKKHHERLNQPVKTTDVHLVICSYLMNKNHNLPTYIFHDDADMLKLAKAILGTKYESPLKGYRETVKTVKYRCGHSLTLVDLDANFN